MFMIEFLFLKFLFKRNIKSRSYIYGYFKLILRIIEYGIYGKI